MLDVRDPRPLDPPEDEPDHRCIFRHWEHDHDQEGTMEHEQKEDVTTKGCSVTGCKCMNYECEDVLEEMDFH